MKNNDCRVCNRIKLIKESNNPYFVTELETGYVVLGDYQFYMGYSIFICKYHKYEIHELPKEIREKFLQEMSMVAESVYKAFNPHKLNYELLGNKDPHIHWHFFPRYTNDPDPENPTWLYNKLLRCNEKTKPTTSELSKLKKRLLNELNKLRF